MFTFFEFIYNNFIIFSILFVSIALTVVLFRSVLMEIIFNKRLNVTKKSLRSYTEKEAKQPKLRSFYKVFLPLLIPIVFILAILQNPVIYDEHVNQVESQNDLTQIHNNFQSKFYQTTSTQKLSDEEHIDIMEEQRNKELRLDAYVDDVVVHNQHVFALSDDAIEISSVNHNDQEATHQESLPVFDDQTQPLGLFIEGQTLYLVGKTDGNSESYSLDEYQMKTKLYAYDIDTFEKTDTFSFSGTPNEIDIHEGVLRIASEQYLPYDKGDFDSDNILPEVNHNGDRVEQLYSSMRHIEGTNPNNLLTIYTLDLDTHVFNMDTTLLSINNHVRFHNEEIFIINRSYQFVQASDFLELEDPVEATNTSLTKLETSGIDVDYYRTRMIEGEKAEEPLALGTGLRMVITRNDDGYLEFSRFTKQLDIFAELTTSIEADIDSLFFHRQVLYLMMDNGEIRPYDTSQPTIIRSMDDYNIENLPSAIFHETPDGIFDYRFEDDRIALNIFTRDHNVLISDDAHSVHTPPTFKQSALETTFNASDIQHMPEFNQFYIPTVMSEDLDETNDSPSYVTRINQFGFKEDAYALKQEDYFTLPEAIHDVSNFVYRAHVDDDLVYHITPKGIAISSVEDVSEFHSIVQY